MRNEVRSHIKAAAVVLVAALLLTGVVWALAFFRSMDREPTGAKKVALQAGLEVTRYANPQPVIPETAFEGLRPSWGAHHPGEAC